MQATQIPGASPRFLKVWWLSASPFAFLFVARVLWEETFWTWLRGPQAVGFALWHVHSSFAVVGTLCALTVPPCLLLSVPYAIARRHDIEPWDWFMMAASVFVIVALTVPDNFLAH